MRAALPPDRRVGHRRRHRLHSGRDVPRHRLGDPAPARARRHRRAVVVDPAYPAGAAGVLRAHRATVGARGITRSGRLSGIRILQIYPKDDYFTGASIQLRELAQQLAQRGHEVVVVTRPSEHWARLCRGGGLVHYALPMASEVDLASAWRLARILKTHQIDVVHAQKGKGRTLALLAGPVVANSLGGPNPGGNLSPRPLLPPRWP